MADKERIVVKIGTSSLIQENGRVNLASIDRLAFRGGVSQFGLDQAASGNRLPAGLSLNWANRVDADLLPTLLGLPN